MHLPLPAGYQRCLWQSHQCFPQPPVRILTDFWQIFEKKHGKSSGSLPACYHLQRLLPGPLNDARALRGCEDLDEEMQRWGSQSQIQHDPIGISLPCNFHNFISLYALLKSMLIENLLITGWKPLWSLGSRSAGSSPRPKSMAFARGASIVRVAAWRVVERHAGGSEVRFSQAKHGFHSIISNLQVTFSNFGFSIMATHD